MLHAHHVAREITLGARIHRRKFCQLVRQLLRRFFAVQMRRAAVQPAEAAGMFCRPPAAPRIFRRDNQIMRIFRYQLVPLAIIVAEIRQGQHVEVPRDLCRRRGQPRPGNDAVRQLCVGDFPVFQKLMAHRREKFVCLARKYIIEALEILDYCLPRIAFAICAARHDDRRVLFFFQPFCQRNRRVLLLVHRQERDDFRAAFFHAANGLIEVVLRHAAGLLKQRQFFEGFVSLISGENLARQVLLPHPAEIFVEGAELLSVMSRVRENRLASEIVVPVTYSADLHDALLILLHADTVREVQKLVLDAAFDSRPSQDRLEKCKGNAGHILVAKRHRDKKDVRFCVSWNSRTQCRLFVTQAYLSLPPSAEV